MNDTPLRRLLERLADVTIVGLLTIACTLPVITGLAALTAAAATVGRSGSGSLPARYVDAFRARFRSTISAQLVVLAAFVIGGSDLAVGLWWAGEPDRPALAAAAVLACGALLVGAAATLPPWLASLAVLGSAPATIRWAAALAIARPAATLGLGVGGALLLGVGMVLPVLSPVFVGLYAVLSLTIVRRATHSMHSEPSRFPNVADECWPVPAP